MTYPSQSGSNRFYNAGLEWLFSQRTLVFGLILILALAGFELFNFSTTLFALDDLLGKQQVWGISWGVILASAFCAIDFAGIARIFVGNDQTNSSEVWYLFGAWLLAATINAVLTWWGVSMSLVNRETMSGYFVDQSFLTRAVPVGIAVIVWVTRILLISTFSSTGSHLFSAATEQAEQGIEKYNRSYEYDEAPPQPRPSSRPNRPSPARPVSEPLPMAAAPRPAQRSMRYSAPKTEPEYLDEPEQPTPNKPAYHRINGSEPTRRGPSGGTRF